MAIAYGQYMFFWNFMCLVFAKYVWVVLKKTGMCLVIGWYIPCMFNFRIGYAFHMTMSEISSEGSAYVWNNLQNTILANRYVIQENHQNTLFS